jgi:hypothetical protein
MRPPVTPDSASVQPLKQRMEAELMFDNPEARDRAIVALTKRGFEVELLDYVDEYEGVILTPTVWIAVTGAYAGSEDAFFDEMRHLAEHFSGDVMEAGLQFPVGQRRVCSICDEVIEKFEAAAEFGDEFELLVCGLPRVCWLHRDGAP